MSDYYQFHLRFDVRSDAPTTLHKALVLRSEGGFPKREDVSDLPGTVQDYLCNGGVPGDGIYLYEHHGPKMKYRDGAMREVPLEPQEASHSLRMAQTFHDDEYWNGGMYYVHWLYQFAANDGPIGTMQQINGNEPPAILTKASDRIIETRMAYNPARFWPMDGQAEPDPEQPMLIERQNSFSLSEMMENIAAFADGPCFD
ncbi:hypothetical protein [Parasulfitobacter algicola]|uniref:Uncharacterized protein n=1 Tax=Parasulfitobacter algicola TaxID=2614809 RepID=A0ABX2ISZ7_9RHOB|nr:hypothetical protein [Sulfitobacter algicola]NSX56037.1 hypothetical protein [Sulfitobacter algicola]